jgi:hypothetical protein
MTFTYTGEQNTEKSGHTSMPRAGFEATISVFERSKTIPLDRVATGAGRVVVEIQTVTNIMS